MQNLELPQEIAVWILPVLFAITVHEVAHGWVAKQLGDPTAQMLGRLTLNPIKHVDPLGTVIVPLIFLLLPGGLIFGWAKPVPVTWENLRRPKRDMALVAIAGPLANLLMAIGWALVKKFGLLMAATMPSVAIPLIYMGTAGILINLVLMILNLIPLPPLDGGRVLTGVLPGPLAWQVSRIEPYGFLVLITLLMTGILGQVIWPVLAGMMRLFDLVFGI